MRREELDKARMAIARVEIDDIVANTAKVGRRVPGAGSGSGSHGYGSPNTSIRLSCSVLGQMIDFMPVATAIRCRPPAE